MGAIVIHAPGTLTGVNEELKTRLSFPWLTPSPIPRRPLALIGDRSLTALQGHATAAASLNIALVVFDKQSHWIADNKTCSSSVGPPHVSTNTRQLDASIFCRRVSNAAELDALLAQDGAQLPYSLIVKPSRGWASEGVWKVISEPDLRDKVSRLWRDNFTAWHGRDVVIESFVDGPEIDANLVLVDGVFHVEGRLIDSQCCYTELASTSLDLARNKYFNEKDKTDVFLLEINPRAPGMQEVNTVARAYGVSYYSLSLLNALGEPKRQRMRNLSIPFTGGAQYHMYILFPAVEKGAVYHLGDVCELIRAKNPELQDQIVESKCLLTNGQAVPDPKTGSMTWLAYFLIISRKSRRDALEVGERVKSLASEYTGRF
ncbi:hypothetical protein B0H63DRAFT_522999 [Podospora didyma]|uniref:ATP-grasp domain-containing protein n=1 Tax=Podospora didyma TaxID=330526 RepID=A0AAE0U023_9PEZI|nr:hypothetical protein B0H63DRAFT_522999 [Podospora didyma]